METSATAAGWAAEQVAVARDDPAARLALAGRMYRGPFGRAPRHLPYRRAAMAFMRWQLLRGVLDCIQDGSLTYAWPFEERRVWQPRRSVTLKLAHRVLPPARRGRRGTDLPGSGTATA